MSALGLPLLFLSGLITPTDAFPARVIEPQAAAETFISTCWRGLRDAERFSVAASESPLLFAPAPSKHGGNRQKSEQAELHHFQDPEYCVMTIRLANAQDAERLVALLTERLGLAAPERAWVMDLGTAMYQWADVPIDCRHYHLEAEADIAARNPPIDFEIGVAFTNRMAAPAGRACSPKS